MPHRDTAWQLPTTVAAAPAWTTCGSTSHALAGERARSTAASDCGGRWKQPTPKGQAATSPTASSLARLSSTTSRPRCKASKHKRLVDADLFAPRRRRRRRWQPLYGTWRNTRLPRLAPRTRVDSTAWPSGSREVSSRLTSVTLHATSHFTLLSDGFSLLHQMVFRNWACEVPNWWAAYL